jgi:hypothetical protein
VISAFSAKVLNLWLLSDLSLLFDVLYGKHLDFDEDGRLHTVLSIRIRLVFCPINETRDKSRMASYVQLRSTPDSNTYYSRSTSTVRHSKNTV